MPRIQKKDGQCRGKKGFGQAQAKTPQGFSGLSLRKAGFEKVFKTGKKVFYKRELAVFYKENPAGANRFGFIVPKKIVRLSTRRNRSRRCLREACRLNQGKIKAGFDIIVYSYKDISGFEEAEKLLLFAIDKAGLLKNR